MINRLVSNMEGPGDRRNATVFAHEESVVWSEGDLLPFTCSFVSIGRLPQLVAVPVILL